MVKSDKNDIVCLIKWPKRVFLEGLLETKDNSRKLSCFSISSHITLPSCDGDLEFSGMKIHWPWLVNQLRVRWDLWCSHPQAESLGQDFCEFLARLQFSCTGS